MNIKRINAKSIRFLGYLTLRGTTLGLIKDGSVLATGSNDYGQANVSDWSQIAAISVGAVHSVAVKKDGTAVAEG